MNPTQEPDRIPETRDLHPDRDAALPTPHGLAAKDDSAAKDHSAAKDDSAGQNFGRWVWRGLQALAIVISLAAIYLAVGFASQTWFSAEVDPNLDQLAVIKNSEPAGQPPSAKSPPGPDRAALPGILSEINEEAIASAVHPLDPLLQVAEKARAQIQNSIFDYQAVMINQVRVGRGALREPQFMQIKIRHERQLENGDKVPLSIYTKFLKPASMAGQEAIWVRGANNNQLIGHPPTGMLNLLSLELDPTGAIAMKGNRYPIYEMGIARLLDIIIEKGQRDRGAGDCLVTIDRQARVDDRPCLMLEIKHPQRQEPFDFHIARIFIDLELQMPVAYEGYDWPKPGTNEPILLEKYVYTQIKLNPGLTDRDFDPANSDYEYPDR